MNWNIAEFTAAYGTAAQLPKCQTPEIAFAGKSNVGKSTLINKLFQRKNLARVSAVPGKTATINFYHCDGITFADLPGYGYAKRSKSELIRWQNLINGYLQDDRDLRAVLLSPPSQGVWIEMPALADLTMTASQIAPMGDLPLHNVFDFFLLHDITPFLIIKTLR